MKVFFIANFMSYKTFISLFFLSLLDFSFGGDYYSKEEGQSSTDFLLCRYCGYNIAAASMVANLNSPIAESVDNYTLFGLKNIDVQTLRNPHGVEFSTVTTLGATCLGYSKQWHTEDSWYPGYAWKACKCRRCQKHLGWVFEPLASASDERIYASQKGFYILNLETVISEADADSLIASPKLF